jgi:hypothetical protein
MDKSLSTLTKILLGLWALVTIPGGLLLLFIEPFANSVVWPAPLEPIPFIHAQFNGALGIGTGIASVLALRQNRWGGAVPVIGMYVAYAIFAEYTAITNILRGPVPLQIWFYVILGIFYLVSSFIVWRQQS